MDTKRIVIRVLHWWQGCAKFNRLRPHWVKGEREKWMVDSQPVFPKCTICKGSGYWIYGYKHYKPDNEAQRVQGGEPDSSSAYWAKNDGHA